MGSALSNSPNSLLLEGFSILLRRWPPLCYWWCPDHLIIPFICLPSCLPTVWGLRWCNLMSIRQNHCNDEHGFKAICWNIPRYLLGIPVAAHALSEVDWLPARVFCKMTSLQNDMFLFMFLLCHGVQAMAVVALLFVCLVKALSQLRQKSADLIGRGKKDDRYYQLSCRQVA